jgi:molybdate transport system regulatory protein
MNKLTGTIKQIQQSGAILLVDIDVLGQGFSALLIESAIRPQWLEVGNAVDVVFKETEVSLAKDLQGKISMRNRLNCNVTSINRGELLSTVTMQFAQFFITSAITTRAVDSLNIAVHDNIIALVKSNEISLMNHTD